MITTLKQKFLQMKSLGKMPLLTAMIAVFVLLFGVRFYDGVEMGREYAQEIGLLQADKPALTAQISRAQAQQNLGGGLRPNEPDIRFQDGAEQDFKAELDRGPSNFNLPVNDESLIFDEGMSDEEIELLQSLAKRRDALELKERELRTREALLAAAEQQLDLKTEELVNLRKEIEELIGLQQTEQDKRINSLVRTYENMKPKDAARIFDTLDLDVLLPVISRMAERRMAPILAEMSSEKARIVTIRLAEQKKLPEIPQE